MHSIVHVALLSLLIGGTDSARILTKGTTGEDCSWAKLDISTGWGCETIKAFTGGMQGNTKLVKLFPPGGEPFLAVLKEMNSNHNPMGLRSLENERKVATVLANKGFDKMPAYYFDLKVKAEFKKYVHSETMTMGQKEQCDNQRSSHGICKINPSWDKCNGNRGNINTTVDIPRRQLKTKGLACPDTQLLAMEFLDGYADLVGMQLTLSKENGFTREVRAAALFLAFDEMARAGVSHCDFNPGNAMFKKSDPRVAKIIDFGLARLNDHPTGACRGNLEDIGTPGFLWLSLYRGHRNDLEFAQNDRKSGPLSLSSNAAFDTPSHRRMQPFSRMRGKYKGKGGIKAWNQETRQNWPGILAYAQDLMEQAGGAALNALPFAPVVQEGMPVNERFQDSETSMRPPPLQETAPRGRFAAEEHVPSSVEEQPRADEHDAPKCVSVWADRHPGPCKLTLRDRSPCLVTLKCSTGRIVKQVITKEDAGFGGRLEIDDCRRCQIK